MKKSSLPVVIFLEQKPIVSSEFFEVVSSSAKKNGFELKTAESVPDAERLLKGLSSAKPGPVAILIPVLYPDLLRAVKTLPPIDPFAKIVFLHTSNEVQVARKMVDSYVLTGLERTLAACEETTLAMILEEAEQTVLQQRKQRTALTK